MFELDTSFGNGDEEAAPRIRVLMKIIGNIDKTHFLQYSISDSSKGLYDTRCTHRFDIFETGWGHNREANEEDIGLRI